MTLHEAIVEVLKTKKISNAKDIAERINALKLYVRKDGKPVPTSQIHARIKNYPQLFQNKISNLYELRANLTEGSDDYQRLTSDLFNLFSRSKHAGEGILTIELCLWTCYVKFLFAMSKRFSAEQQRESGSSNTLALRLAEVEHANANEIQQSLGSLTDALIVNGNLTPRLQAFIKMQLHAVNASVWYEAFVITKSYQFDTSTLSKLLSEFEKIKGLYLKGSANRGIQVPDYILNLIGTIAKFKDIQGKMLNAFTELTPVISKLSIKATDQVDLHTDMEAQAVFLELRNLFVSNKNTILCYDFLRLAEVGEASYDAVFGIVPSRVIIDPTGNSKFRTLQGSVKNAELAYVEAITSMLKTNGIAFVVVPQSLLSASSGAHYYLRELLVSKDWVEAVISLPLGMDKSNSGVKQDLLILNKNKEESKKGRIHFLNSVYTLESTNQVITQHPEDILESLEKPDNSSNSRVVTMSEVLEIDSILQPERYISPVQHELEKLKSERKEICLLNEILTVVKEKIESNDAKVPFIKISDLKNSDSDFELSFASETSVETWSQKGMHLSQPVLLVARIGENLKPTFFSAKERNIVISPNILAFTLDESKVRIEFLIQEFRSDLFLKQFRNILTGAAQLTWRVNEFLNIALAIPSLHEQDKIIREKLQILHRLKQSEADTLAEKSGARKREYSILSTVRHSLSQQFSSIRNDVESLKYFLASAIDARENISWTSEISKKRSLEQLIARMDDSILSAEHTFDKIKSLTELNRRELKFEKTELVTFIQKTISEINLPERDFALEINALDTNGEWAIVGSTSVESIRLKPIWVDIDRFLIQEFFRNIVENAMKHGKVEDHKLFIDLYIEGDPEKNKNIGIAYYDSGKGVKNDFSYDDFFEFGKKSGESGGSGIGGYILKQIVNLHGGQIDGGNNLVVGHPDYSNFQLDLTLPFNQNYD